MKADQIINQMAVETNDATLRRSQARQGIVVNGKIKKEGTLSKVLVLFDGETKPRYVPISRLKAKS